MLAAFLSMFATCTVNAILASVKLQVRDRPWTQVVGMHAHRPTLTLPVLPQRLHASASTPVPPRMVGALRARQHGTWTGTPSPAPNPIAGQPTQEAL